MAFTGFTKEAPKFLFENRMNNSKEWYDEHKPVYKEFVYNPLVELIAECAPTIHEIDDQIITVPSKIISRVRRDTRFTKDKTLYRDHAWIVFLRDKAKMSTSPCFWFEIGQKGSSYGVGYYGAEASAMASFRTLILNRNPVAMKAVEAYEAQNQFVIGGEMYKKSRYPDQPENLKLWLDRKNIFFECAQSDYKLVFSDKLPEAIKTGYMLIKPVYELFMLAESF